MQQIKSMAAALGLGTQPEATPPPQPAPPAQTDTNALASLLGALGTANGQSTPPAQGQMLPQGGITPEALQTISRIAPLLSQVNREDDSTRLLHALRPLLSPPRQKKLDEAVKILQMMRLLPLLKDSGLLSSLL